MKITKKRVVSILLSMTMVMALFAVMPVAALAAGPDVAGTCELYDEFNVKIGITYSFNGALAEAAVNDNYTIKLLNNIETTTTIEVYNDISLTIDLNNFTLDIACTGTDSALDIMNSVKLTI